jgi:hypothetical protein
MPAPRKARVGNFAGSTNEEIKNDPDWHAGHNHRVGYRNNQNRIAGFTHDGDYKEEEDDDREFTKESMNRYRSLRERARKGDVLNFQDIMHSQSVRAYAHPPVPRLTNSSDGEVPEIGLPSTPTRSMFIWLALYGSQYRGLHQE